MWAPPLDTAPTFLFYESSLTGIDQKQKHFTAKDATGAKEKNRGSKGP